MASSNYIYNQERSFVVNYLNLMPQSKPMAIMSSPDIVMDNSLSNITRIFQTKVWILILMLFLLILLTNTIQVKVFETKMFIALDYYSLLLCKGIT